jgi:hypothetical protein
MVRSLAMFASATAAPCFARLVSGTRWKSRTIASQARDAAAGTANALVDHRVG